MGPIISWLQNGQGFSVHNRKKLICDVLPMYFKTKKYASFTRRLRRWGFSCFARGHGSYVYYHPMFLRDKPELTLYMACCSQKVNEPTQRNPAAAFLHVPPVP